MFSNPIMYAWIAWLLVVSVIAGLRCAAHQREERRRAERRQQRQTGQVAQPASDQTPVISPSSVTSRRSAPADHKPQLALTHRLAHSVSAGAAGIIQPASDLATPDPATQV